MNATTTALPATQHPRIGRPPKPVILDAADAALLEQMVSSSYWPEHQVRKAKALLAVARGARVRDVVAQLGYSAPSIWRCRDRFRKGGIAALLIEGHRTGRPPRKHQPDDPTGVSSSALSSPRPR